MSSLTTYEWLVLSGAVTRASNREKLMGRDLLEFDISVPKGAESPRESLSINHKLWLRVDELMDQMMSEEDSTKKWLLKSELRGLAYALSHMMIPLFESPKEISQEALRRWKARESGTEYQTPCVGSRWRDNPVVWRQVHVLGKKLSEVDGDPSISAPEERPLSTKPRKFSENKGVTAKRSTLDAEKIAAVKKSTFPSAVLAKAYGVTVKEIDAIRGEGK